MGGVLYIQYQLVYYRSYMVEFPWQASCCLPSERCLKMRVSCLVSSLLWLRTNCSNSLEYRSSLRRGFCVCAPVMFGRSVGFWQLAVRWYARYRMLCYLYASFSWVALWFGVSFCIRFFLHATNQWTGKFTISVTSTRQLVN